MTAETDKAITENLEKPPHQSSLEEQVERGLYEYLEGFYRELVKNYSHVPTRAFTILDSNTYYTLLFFPSEKTSIGHAEINLDHVTLTLSKARDQPCLCSLYELRYSLKGQRISKKRSFALGYILLVLREKLCRLESSSLLLEDSRIATPIATSLIEDMSIKSLDEECDAKVLEKKTKQVCELIPSLFSLVNLEKSRELLSFSLEQ